MHSFKTADGVVREIRLTLGAIKAAKSATGVDLVNADKPREGQEVPVVTEVFMDVDLLVSVLYAIQKTYDPALADISQADYEQLFTGEVLDHAHTAFFEALQDFFLNTRRPALAEMISQQAGIVRAQGEAAVAELANQKLPERAAIAIRKSIGEAFSSMPELSASPT